VSYSSEPQPEPDPYGSLRSKMVYEQIERRGVVDSACPSGDNGCATHLFVAGAITPQAYSDGPLPIGLGRLSPSPILWH